jgi:lipopolysaccharide/colanic/teichoic acid biosynthesis glycosyltransferase
MRNTAAIRILPNFQAKRDSKIHRVDRIAKRLFDFTASAIGLLFLFPIFAYIAWRIRRDSPGPVFYHGERLGKDGKTFRILKFRTMYEAPESHQGPRLTAQDDPRITPFGRWLRDSKLNELPQLWNVLKGEMSLVGPRPEDPILAASWPKDARNEIISVRPGITSPASVLYRDEETLLSSKQLMDTYLGEILPSKLRLDQLYVRHRSFWSDLDIIFWTLLSLVPRMRDKEFSEPSLFVGPFSRFMHRHVRWFFIDILVTMAALALAGLFWRTMGPLHVGWNSALILAFCFASLFSITNYFLKISQIEWSCAAASDALDLLPGVGISLFTALVINNLLPPQWVGVPVTDSYFQGALSFLRSRPLLPNGMLILSAGLAAAGFIVVRYRSRLITGIATRWVAWRGVGNRGFERVLIVGGGDTGQFAAWLLQNEKYALSLNVVGFVDDNLYMQDSRIHGLNVLGRREDIPTLVDKLDIGIIVFAIHNISQKERRRLMEICWNTDARVFDFPDIPRAIKQISRSNEPDHGEVHISTNSSSDGIAAIDEKVFAPAHVDRMLAQLEQIIQRGDVSGTLEEIQKMRSLVRENGLNKQAAQLSSAD